MNVLSTPLANEEISLTEESSYQQILESSRHYGETQNQIETPSDFSFRVRAWERKIPKKFTGLMHIDQLEPSQEGQCGNDDRISVSSTITPYKMICKLIIENQYGRLYYGSGFFISKRCVITSGHCVHSAGEWVKSVRVIPGAYDDIMPFGSSSSSVFRSVKGWVKDEKSDFDHGAIILPDDTLYKKVGGFFGFKLYEEEKLINNSGYPLDRAVGQWFDAGEIKKETDHRLYYMVDTYGGSSGSPIFIKDGDQRLVIGVHGYSGCPNSCVKVNTDVLQIWSTWSKL